MSEHAATESRARSFAVVTAVYVVAAAAALFAGWLVRSHHPVTVAFVADLAATVAVFAASMLLRNSSMYDAYWSVVPPVIALGYLVAAEPGADGLRQFLVMAGVLVWAVRLTSNWARDWPGLHHEDWRYVDMRASSPLPWPVTSFLAVHLFPTLQVFLPCLALWPALGTSTRGVGPFDVVAVALMVGGAALEYVADEQMRRFRRTKQPGQIMRLGLWARCRHPNYLGEILFWIGVGVAGVAADPSWWWVLVGPLAMIAMFVGASIPMLDRRSAERRPGYETVIAELPALLPLGPRRSRSGS